MPLRSIITPMKMKVGIATSTRFSAAWPQMRGTKLKNCTSLNEPRKKPRKPKSSASPPRMKATGYPEKSSTPSVRNMRIGRSSCTLYRSSSLCSAFSPET